jgi:hypothetical protein
MNDGISIGKLPEYELDVAAPDPWQFTTYPVMPRKQRLKVRMRNDEYFVDEEGIYRSGRMYGNIMHMLFSRIDRLSDVDRVVAAFQKEGLLPGREPERIRDSVHEMITRAGVEEWFSGTEKTIYNERSILCGAGRVIRPDRVMIDGDLVTVVDFKFGEVERAHYSDQVAGYMQQLSRLGYQKVNGYVWYVNLGRTIQINPS